MSTVQTARDMSVGVLTYVRDYVSHIFENVFSTATTNAAVATTVKNNTPAYETPYVWAREFLEESGFNLTERIPALLGVYEIPGVQYIDNFPARRIASTVPPELSLHWILSVLGSICEAMIDAVRGLGMGDVAWFIFFGLVIAVLYHWRVYLLPILFRAWEELKEDVAAFMRRQFPPPPFACNELPPGTTTISSEDVNALHTSADAIQRRMNYLRMSKFNYVRSRTGIIFNLHNFSKLHAQLTKTQKALKEEKATRGRHTVNFVRSRRAGVVPKPRRSGKLQEQLAKVRKALANERASHEETRDFLEHQTNARADVEEELEELKAKLEAEEPELDEIAQLEMIEETDEESPAADDRISQPIPNESTVEATDSQDDAVDGNPQPSTHLDTTQEVEAEPQLQQTNAQIERLQRQLKVEEANYRAAFKKKEVFRQGGRKLKQELEDLQAEYNVLEDSRDTWRETCEALEEQADVKAVRGLRDQMQSDNAHNERRIDALQTQLGFERNNREEAQSVARGLRESYRKLQEDLEEANAKYESLQSAYEDLDNMHDAEERANEEKGGEITVLKAKYDLLQSELIKMDERQEEMDVGRNGARETGGVEEQGESWRNYDFGFREPQGSRTINAEEGAPLRRVQSAPLWLPLPHHGDTFNPLYDVSDYGDDNSDREDENEDEDHDQDADDHDDDKNSRNKNGSEDGKDGNEDSHDGRNGGADKVAPDADIANSPGCGEDRASSTLPLDNEQLPANLPSPEPSSQGSTFSMNGSAPNFIPVVRPKEPTPPLLPHNQSYIASQHGSTSSEPGSDSVFQFTIRSPLQNQHQFPQVGVPEHTPAPKAAGPGQAKNPHVQKLNQEVKRLDWRRKSGMPDRAEDEEGVAAPDDVMDAMYDRQVAQSLNPTLISSRNDLQPSSPSLAPERDVPQQEITAPPPVPASESQAPESQARESSPPAASATDGSSPAAQGNLQDRANVAHDGEPSRPRRPSNFFPGLENATKTYNEEVSDALAEYLASHPTKSLSESIWAKKPDTSSKPTLQQASPAPASATDAPLRAAEGQTHDDRANDEAAHQEQHARPRRPSNLFPGMENATMTHNEEVSDALAACLSQHPTKSLSESIWAKKADASSKQTPQQAAPAPASTTDASSPAAQGRTQNEANAEAAHQEQPARPRRPSNLFPGMENATMTHNEEVSDALADYLSQHPTKSLSESIWAKKPETSSKATPQHGLPAPAADTPPPPPPSPRAPNQPAIGATTRAPLGPTQAPPAATGVGNSIWSPRGGRGSGQGARGQTPPSSHTPNQSGVGAVNTRAPLGTPQHPPAGGTGVGSSIWSPRGNGRGRGGRGARGGAGRGGAATSAPKPGNAASESFRRLQERIARDKAAEEAKKEMEGNKEKEGNKEG